MTLAARPAGMHGDAALIGLDWGSSRLRAALLAADGTVLEARHADAGASTLRGGATAFSMALTALIGDWHVGPSGVLLPVLACGMAGSQHGWREAPYLPCPADAAALVAASVRVDWQGQAVHLLPGLCCTLAGQAPDVMRGEETQALGALSAARTLRASSVLVMPGTHSKWAWVRQGQIQGFATHMTGELFAVLSQHSVLGRLLPQEMDWSAPAPDHDHAPSCQAAFAEGVRAAWQDDGGGLLHQLFAVRTRGLIDQWPGAALRELLSGLLLGHELRAGLAWRRQHAADAPLALVGEEALTARYAQALALCAPDVALQPVPDPAQCVWRALASFVAH
ncbi:2-dehydro-3-deoxygalactonokinase [Roseateles paludis]|uniref:2-dehydro-3-deoxygalactonokinase n=1 Tax=Roseateles paludis TaxID=3145238 RepID=A0ABV0G2R2_9BURK